MARILFSVPPLTGHLNPALAVAAELARDGHQIAWAVHQRELSGRLPADARIFPLDAEASPADDTAAGGDDRQVRGVESVRLFFEDYAIPMARRMLAPLEAVVREFRPHMMVVDHQMPGAALVARKLGVPWVTLVSTSASILRTSSAMVEWVAAQYRSLQAGYLPAPLQVERPDFSPQAVIVFSTERLIGDAHPRFDAPYRFVGPAQAGTRTALRPEVAFPWDWLRDDTRKLLVSLGTVSRDRDTRFFEVVMAALDGMPGIQAVMVAPAALQARAPDNVLVREYVPQLELLDRVDGVICHAGHNTVCEALARGLPLIVAPIRDDQPVIARQVIDAGAGLFMRHGKVSPAVARSTIERLLADKLLAANARLLGHDLKRAPGAAGAAQAIVELLPADYAQLLRRAG